jgi:hypothetical protein
MRGTKMIVVVFGLLSLLLASAAPAMAQSAPPWGANDYWGNQWSPSDYYDNAYQQFQDNCLGVTSGDQCVGVGQDLDYYLNNYDGGGVPYWDPSYQDPYNGDPYAWYPYPQG